MVYETALELISKNFTDTGGLLQPKKDYVPTKEDYEAIDYLCNEWDYGYSSDCYTCL